MPATALKRRHDVGVDGRRVGVQGDARALRGQVQVARSALRAPVQQGVGQLAGGELRLDTNEEVGRDVLRAAIVVDAGACGAALAVQYEERVTLDVQPGQL